MPAPPDAAATSRSPFIESKNPPALPPGVEEPRAERISEPVENLVRPESLQAVQRLVERGELFRIDAADLFHCLDMLVVEGIDDVADLAALLGQLDAHGAAIDPRALMIEETDLDQLLEIVGDVGAEIVTARAQFAGGQFLAPDVVEQQRLHRIDV